jgi:hypothetical protein
MPDITMCAQDDCPMMGDCYRHEATPTPLTQSFAVFAPETETECSMFMEIWGSIKDART